MDNKNPFPESDEKAYLRRVHFNYLANRKKVINRDLNYFGLPSVELLDVQLWRSVLGNITAVERDSDLILPMLRTARRLNLRSKLILIEDSLSETTRLLAMEDRGADLSLLQLPLPVQQKIRQARSIAYDVINLDLCGGFLYPKQEGESENVQVLNDLVKYQSKYKQGFILIITYQLRDTGAEHYDFFITEALGQLAKLNIDTLEVRQFYTADQDIEGQPPHLRRLRFCIPTYIHRSAYQNFQVRSQGAWYYKNFYHTALVFEPRMGKNALGLPWPPVDEFKGLLESPMWRVEADTSNQIILSELAAPSIS